MIHDVLHDHSFEEITGQVNQLSSVSHETLAKAVASIYKIFPRLRLSGRTNWENIVTLELECSVVYAPAHGIRSFDIVCSLTDQQHTVFPNKIKPFIPEWGVSSILIDRARENRLQLSPQLQEILQP